MPKCVDQDQTKRRIHLAVYQVQMKVTLKNHQEGLLLESVSLTVYRLRPTMTPQIPQTTHN